MGKKLRVAKFEGNCCAECGGAPEMRKKKLRDVDAEGSGKTRNDC